MQASGRTTEAPGPSVPAQRPLEEALPHVERVRGTRSFPAATDAARASRQAAPKSPSAVLADQGISLAQSLSRAHKMSDKQLESHCDEYIQYTGSRSSEPKYKALHDEALGTKAALFEQRNEARVAEEMAALDREMGKLKEQATLRALSVRPPAVAYEAMMVAELATPIAQAASEALNLVPVVGQMKLGVEALSGRNLGTMGGRMGAEERALRGLLALAPVAGKVLGAGARGAKAVLAAAQRTGQTPEQITSTLQALRRIEKEHRAIEKALARYEAGLPLTTLEERVLARASKAVEQIQSGVRGLKPQGRYSPTETPTSGMEAGVGGTSKFGDITYSSLGTAQDVALARNHERFHSFLSPKTLNNLREFRADVAELGYKKSQLLRYTEEALAETYAQIKVRGLSLESLKTGFSFPFKNGYVRLEPWTHKDLGPQRSLRAEGAIGFVVYAGITYAVYAQIQAARREHAASNTAR